MNYHHHARLTVSGRLDLCQDIGMGRLTLREAAASRRVSRQTAGKWARRHRQEGPDGLRDRSSRPHHFRCPTPDALVAQVLALRRQRLTGHAIAQATGLSRATVSRLLRRAGLNRVRDLDPPPPVQRYERPCPGDLLHLDVKKLGRILRPGHRVAPAVRGSVRAGWEYLHVAIDDHSRLALADVLTNERGPTAADFLRTAVAGYAHWGFPIRAVLTDNGPAYRSCAFAHACRELGLKHHFTRPYTPRTNGKAERFIKTSLAEWAYARSYQHSTERSQELRSWLHSYNW
ncbi:MAG: IS481 family transposase, partial [Terriglobales bacterium]